MGKNGTRRSPGSYLGGWGGVASGRDPGEGRRWEGRCSRWLSELAFCHWLATGRKRKVQDKALWETGSRGEAQCGTPNSEVKNIAPPGDKLRLETRI